MRKSCHVVFIVRRTNGSLTFVSWHYDISLIWTCSSQSDVQRLLTPWTVMANHHSLYCNKNAGQCLSVATLDGSTGHTHTWDILQIWDKQQVEILVLLMYQILHTTVHRHTTIVTNETFVNSREGGGGACRLSRGAICNMHILSRQKSKMWHLASGYAMCITKVILSRQYYFCLTKVTLVEKSKFCHDKSTFVQQKLLLLTKVILSRQK